MPFSTLRDVTMAPTVETECLLVWELKLKSKRDHFFQASSHFSYLSQTAGLIDRWRTFPSSWIVLHVDKETTRVKTTTKVSEKLPNKC
ncbi:hypothetical protein WAI453_009631 [Rhynchosporium graminicola]